MAYTSEPMPSAQAPAPNAAPPVMREERVLDPYRSRVPQLPVPQSREQPAISRSVSTEEPSAPTAESVTLGPAAAALARKEQRFRQQQQELKARETALEAERAEIAELKAIKAKLASKDFSSIEQLVPYNEYTNYLIEKDAGLSPEHQELKKLQSDIEAVKKAQQDDVSKRFEAAVSERRKAVTALVESNEAFTGIAKMKAHEAVVQHILDTWEHDNVDLSVEDAAREVEETLREQANRWASIVQPATKQAEVSEDKNVLPPLKPVVKTLTNNMSATGEIKRPVKSFHGMSDSERYAEARRRAEEKMQQRG